MTDLETQVIQVTDTMAQKSQKPMTLANLAELKQLNTKLAGILKQACI